ncbi:MAG: hypothetical protein ACI3ZF_01880 [Candidatus Cryptobacteroides sp.]
MCACGRPDGAAEFVRGDRMEYEFVLSVEDTEALYDLSLVAKVDGLEGQKGTDLEIRWYSPDNHIYIEKGWLPLEGRDGILQPYRDGVNFREKGNWHIRIYPKNSAVKLAGMGIEMRRTNGTR